MIKFLDIVAITTFTTLILGVAGLFLWGAICVFGWWLIPIGLVIFSMIWFGIRVDKDWK